MARGGVNSSIFSNYNLPTQTLIPAYSPITIYRLQVTRVISHYKDHACPLSRASAGRRLGSSAQSRILRHFMCRRFLSSDASGVPRLSCPRGSLARSVADPSTLLRRRSLRLGASEVPYLRRVLSHPRTWEDQRFHLSLLVGLRRLFVPAHT